MTHPAPLVTVLMPVYNAGSFLIEAVESVLSQTYQNFEFLIIDDGSTDESPALLETFNDQRIRIIHHDKNRKLIATLNHGLQLSKGKYIVRMDSDDISLPERIARQVDFMEAHPEVGLSGTGFENFGPGIPTNTIIYSGSDTEIRIRHLYQTHIAHPTAILRKSLIEQHQLQFDAAYLHGEDYHFWVSMGRYCKMSNLPEVLVRKRDHAGNVSNMFADIQNSTCNRVKRLQFDWMGVRISEEEAELYSRFANTEWNFSIGEMTELARLLQSANDANLSSRFIDTKVFTNYLAGKWFHLCLNNPKLGRSRMEIFKMLSFRKTYPAALKSRVRMVIKTAAG